MKKSPILYGLALLTGTWIGIQGLNKTAEIILPETLPKIEYVNNDSLPDLVYGPFEKKYQIYLQKEDGTYIPKAVVDGREKARKDSIFQIKKTKLDSIYKVKQDSFKRAFENKLEKVLK